MNDLTGFVLVHRIGFLLAGLLLAGLVLELVRRGLLKERYALLWLATASFGLVVGIFPGVIVEASRLFHFQYLTLVFVMSFLFLVGLVLVFSIVISRLTERNRELAQEMALLSHRVEQLEKDRGS